MTGKTMTSDIGTQLRRALAAHEAGRLDDAERGYRQVLTQAPDTADAQHLLATLLVARQRIVEALPLFESCLASLGSNPAVRCNYGIALLAANEIDQARIQFETALKDHGDFPTALFHLARIERNRGHYGVACDLLGRLLQLHAGSFETFYLFGECLNALGQTDAAQKAFERCFELAGANPGRLNGLGELLVRLDLVGLARAVFDRLLSVMPDYVPALINDAVLRIRTMEIETAFQRLHKAAEIAPDRPEILGNLAHLHTEIGEAAEAVRLLERLVATHPDRPDFHAKLLFTQLYLPEFDGPRALEEARRFADAHAPADAPQPFANIKNPDKRLRIGYLSPDFRTHPSRVFWFPTIRCHDRTAVEVFLYSAAANPDEMTRQWQVAADGWREVYGLSPATIAERIRADRIDILVDMGAGYTRDNPIDVFFHHPAPIQASAYIVSTGLAQMDAFFAHPEGLPDHLPEQSLYRERVVRLNISQMPFIPVETELPVAPLPAAKTGTVTFGAFSKLPKISAPTLEAWCEILSRVPDSRLIVKSTCLSDPFVQQRWRDRFAAKGIDPHRVEMIGQLPDAAHWRLFERIDIALDSFPYSGAATNCEFLWYGIPYVTLVGRHHQARTGYCFLWNLGLEQLAAETVAGYVDKAVTLAGDLKGLAALRASLRQRMENSPLMDAQAVARDYEHAYRHLWQEYCAQ